MAKSISRRGLLRRSLQLYIGGVMAGSLTSAPAADSAAGKVCADPNAMDDSQKGMRESLNYTESAPDPAKTCSGCGFFQAAEGACGKCVIFNDGPVNPHGHCDSWSGKG